MEFSPPLPALPTIIFVIQEGGAPAPIWALRLASLRGLEAASTGTFFDKVEFSSAIFD